MQACKSTYIQDLHEHPGRKEIELALCRLANLHIYRIYMNILVYLVTVLIMPLTTGMDDDKRMVS